MEQDDTAKADDAFEAYMQTIVQYASEKFYIAPDAYELALTYDAQDKLPRKLQWTFRIPNGYALNWERLTERERALIVTTYDKAWHRR